MNQGRPAGLLRREQALRQVEPLTRKMDVELETLVRLLRLADLIGLIGGQEIALRGERKYECETQ